MDGLRLRFHLAGINNQNFLMRDEETGSYWQQISGRAISGPLAGRSLTLVHSDELSFRIWKSEQPAGMVAADVPAYTDQYSPKNWDVRMQNARTVIQFREQGMEPRDLVVGIDAFGGARAFRFDAIVREKLIVDHVGAEPVMLVLGPDEKSVRAFDLRLPGGAAPPSFFRRTDATGGAPLLLDGVTGAGWNFQGCAQSGLMQGTCLPTLPALKDYWFDWRNYHPNTTIYRGH